MRNKRKILLTICVMSLLLFLQGRRIIHQADTGDSPASNTPSKKRSVNNSVSQPDSNRDFLNMSLEELMQIPVASISFMNKSNNFLDMSLEELMNISVPGGRLEQKKKI